MKRKSHFSEYRERTIARNLIFGLITTVAITIFVIGLINYLYFVHTAEKKVISNAREIVRNLAESVSTAIYQRSDDEIRRYIKIYFETDFLIAVSVIFPDGTILLDYREPGEHDSFTIRTPVIYQGNNVGTIEAAFSKESIHTGRRLIIYSSLFSLIGFVLAITIVIHFLIKYQLFSPLDKLRQGIERIASGDYHYRLASVKQTELNIINQEVNEMARQISERTDELRQIQANLEKRVADRTRELEIRLKYEVGLAACSRALLTEAGKKDSLKQALTSLLDASQVSRVYIFENFIDSENGLSMRLLTDVAARGVWSKLPRKGDVIPYKAGFSRWIDILSSGQSIDAIVDSLPKSERELLQLQNTLSILVIPVFASGKWVGFVGFDDVEKKWHWRNEDIRLLKTAAEIIGEYMSRTEMDHALRENEERFRGIVENANDIIYNLNKEGIFTYVSPNVKEKMGLERNEIIGKSYQEFFHPDDLSLYNEFVASLVKTEEKQSSIEYRVRHKDGAWRWHVSSASPLKDKSGNILYFVCIAHDITKIKTAMQKLEEANANIKETQAQLIQSEKMAALGNLVAGIAHEINTPVGAVINSHKTMIRVVEQLSAVYNDMFPTDPNTRERMQKIFEVADDANRVITSGTERVMNIVRRLRSFARIDQDELKTVNMHDGIEDTLAIIRHEIKYNIEIIKNYGDVPPVACYPGQLNQVFLNLLINAKQAIRGQGKILITTFQKDKKIHVVIEDDGEGIPEENLEKIFDPGFTTKGIGVGTGLGLSICYKIMQLHRGEINVESEVGRGSIFTVSFPENLPEIIEAEKSEQSNQEN